MSQEHAQPERAAPPPAERRRPSGAAPQGGDAAGVLSNTPPSNPKTAGGEDWLELALYLRHHDFGALEDRLEWAKQEAEGEATGLVEIELGGHHFIYEPGNARAGAKGKQVNYRWRLKSIEGWQLLLMRRALPHKTMPNGIFRASSIPLIRYGSVAVWRRAQAALREAGATLIANKVSRVDACVDLARTELAPLQEAFVRGEYVTRARSAGEHSVDECFVVDEHHDGYYTGRRPSGFDVGRGDVRLRVYDKWLQCRREPELLALMHERRWGSLGGHAIRAEFQLRREKLKQLGVDTFNNWCAKRASIVSYLSRDWFRLTSGPVDRRHPENAVTHRVWRTIQQAFEEWAGEPAAELAPLRVTPAPPTALLKQTIGLLISYHAVAGTVVLDNAAFFDASLAALQDVAGSRCLPEEVRQRAMEKWGVCG